MKRFCTGLVFCFASFSLSAQLLHDSNNDGCVSSDDLLGLLSEYGTCFEQTMYFFHGGNESYPFTQAPAGLTDPNPGTLYYDDGQGNPFAATTDLSLALSYIMDNMGSPFSPGDYTVEELNIPAAGITALGSADALQFDSSSSSEYYYIILPVGQVDLTSVAPQHLLDGGIETNAVQKALFAWNGADYWLYRLGGGSQTASRIIGFSDND